jgi:uncharacterized membrane protein
MIFAFLKALHFLALMFGAAASLGNLYLGLAKGPHDLAAPGYTNMLRKLYRLTALGAILVFWATGVLMLIANGFDGIALALGNGVFQLKLVFVVVLTGIVLFLNLMAPGWARSGGPPSHVPKLHWIGAACLLLAVIFAAFAFG